MQRMQTRSQTGRLKSARREVAQSVMEVLKPRKSARPVRKRSAASHETPEHDPEHDSCARMSKTELVDLVGRLKGRCARAEAEVWF